MLRFLACLAALLLAPAAALASQCYAFVEGVPGVRYASLDGALLAQEADAVRITYVGHSSFLIETEGGVSIVTDYYGNHGGGAAPTVVTMNKAHETHWTSVPDPAIEHVLPGWGPSPEQPAEHRLKLADVVIRNVTTDIRGWPEPERDANSIFVFEVADMCLGHLGHLHHVPSEEQFALIGQLDIVMAPVDGSWTLSIEEMVETLQRLKARLVLPMHAFSQSGMQRFIQGLSPEFAFETHDGPVLTVSLATLPSTPTVLMMPAGPRLME